MLDELSQALNEQKMCGAERNVIEVLARVLNVSFAIAARMAFAIQCLPHDVGPLGIYIQSWDDYLDAELQDAILLAINNGLRRLLVRDAITRSGTITIAAKCLFPSEEDPRCICNGCSHSLTCIADGINTPEECLETSFVVVYPLRFVTPKQVEVECVHPAGRFIVPLKQFPATPKQPMEPCND